MSAGRAQKGNFQYFFNWDNDKTGGRFFESRVLWYRMHGPVQVLAHDGDHGTYGGGKQVFKITNCPAKKGDHVIAYYDNRAYAFSGR